MKLQFKKKLFFFLLLSLILSTMTDALYRITSQMKERTHDPHALRKLFEEIVDVIVSSKTLEEKSVNLTAATSDAVILSVVSTMEEFPKDEGFQAAGCHVVATICLGPPNKGQISQSIFNREICAVIAAMREFPSSHTIQVYGCGGLFTLVFKSENRVKIIEEGGLEVLHKAMETFGQDPECVRCVVGSIATLNTVITINRELYNKNLNYFKQTPGKLLKKLKVFSTNQGAVSQIMRAIFNMRRYVDWDNVTEEEIDAFLSALNNNPDNRGIQNIGMYMALALAEHEKSASTTARLGGVQTIVSSLRTFIKTPNVVLDNGIYFLSLVAKNSAAAAEVILSEGSGAVEIVLKLMHYHFNLAVIQNYCCMFLGYATKSVAGRRVITSKGGVEVLTEVMLEHKDSGQVQINGIVALSNIFGLDEFRDRYYNKKFNEDIVQVIEKKYTNEPTVKEAVKVIRREETKEAAEAVKAGVCSFEAYKEPSFQWLHPKLKSGSNGEEVNCYACSACWEYNKKTYSEEKIFTFNACTCCDPRCRMVTNFTISTSP